MQRLLWISWLPLYLALSLLSANAATVRGSLVKWHPLDIDFSGPHARETDSAPNPFLDFRLRVILTSPSGVKTTVPGFFAGDGQGNGQGNVWRARFSANAGHPWVLDMDENTNGLGPATVNQRRKQILYDVLFSGDNIE